MDQQDREQLAQLSADASEMVKLLNSRSGIRGGNNQMNFHVNAGGIGVWICVTCFIAALASCLIGSLWMNSELTHIHGDLKDRKDENDSMKAYLAAIYMQAPQLKPKEKEKDHGN